MRRSLYLLVALALVLASCGGDGVADTTIAITPPDTADTTPPETTPDTTPPDSPDTTVGNGEACSTDSEFLHEPGKLTIATGEPVFPPWMMDDDPTNGEGFESAVAYALAEEMGFAHEDVEWVRTTFEEAIAPGERPYDFNMQQYSVTEEREEIVDFSIPYYYSQKSVVALPDTVAAEAATFDDLRQARFGATIGTTDYDYIVQVIGVPEDDVLVYNDQAGTFSALQAGQIDATVIGLPTAYFVTAVQVPEAVIAGVLPREGDEGDGMGLLFTEGNPLVDCVNDALQNLWDDGTIDAIDAEWLQAGGDIPEITE